MIPLSFLGLGIRGVNRLLTMAASKPKSRSVNDIFEIDSQQIGEGAFGVVYRGKNKVTGQSVALKTFKKGSQGEPISQTVYREISVRTFPT